MATNNVSFRNKDITVTYDPYCCKNSNKCFKQLSGVFRKSVIPWINLDGATTNLIINQIKKCPSGALNYELNQKEVA